MFTCPICHQESGIVFLFGGGQGKPSQACLPLMAVGSVCKGSFGDKLEDGRVPIKDSDRRGAGP